MNEKLTTYKNSISEFWKLKTKGQKLMLVGIPILTVLLLSVLTMYMTKDTFVPLYSNLSASETGQIKETLDSRGISSQISDNGTTIMVPKEVVDTLKVELAAEGIPDSGNIDYSFFGENASFGMTDNEFDVIKLEATQTELTNLIKGFEGVNDAKVMISMPSSGVFVTDQQDGASASIVLNTKAGYKFDQEQIKALYHLVAKSVPNLSTDNIVITNQYFEYFDLENEKSVAGIGNIADQLTIKKEIERDIQRQVQQMLGTMMGQDKVVVSVTADIDFTQENREENLVTPVDEENMEGIELSVERITETYSGEQAENGGVVGTGDTDITNYQETAQSGNGDYERIEERVNTEVNRIRKEIVEAPYKIRDLGIQVMVEEPEEGTPLPEERVEDITKILGTIVRTSVAKDAAVELTDEQLQDKVVVSVQPFYGKQETISAASTGVKLPIWIYVVGGVLVLLIIVLLVVVLRKKKDNSIEDVEMEDFYQNVAINLPDVNDEKETESSVKRKQLEKMAKDKPEDFAKLLRTWLAEE